MFWVALSILLICCGVGVLLTFVTLPGIWLMLGVATLCWAFDTDLFSPWVFISAVVLAVLAEVVEFFASAAGSARAGGSKSGAVGSIVGSLIGLVAGQILLPIPIIGAVIGAVIGAGLGATLLERGHAKREWRDSWRSGRGAATGRAVSIVVKGGFAIAVAALLLGGAVLGPGGPFRGVDLPAPLDAVQGDVPPPDVVILEGAEEPQE